MPKLAGYLYPQVSCDRMTASTPKPFKTYDEQIQILQGRGLIVDDLNFARHILTHFNYYRITAYRFPFLVSPYQADNYKCGTRFEDLWDLYRFDQKLRWLVNEACKALEISVRARWAYVMGERFGPQAYEASQAFVNQTRHTGHLRQLDDELDRSREIFVKHYKNKYDMARPPIWAACEVMSFGTLSHFFSISPKNEQKQIAQTYRLQAETMKSLLQQAVYLRNLCAHHSRLWNRKLTITPTLPRSHPPGLIASLDTSKYNEQESRKIYNSLVLLGHTQSVILPDGDWKTRLQTHLGALQAIGLTVAEMGFPKDWNVRPFWTDSIWL